MNKLSYTNYAANVLRYLGEEYECEGELDHSPEGVLRARKFIKKCYKDDCTIPDCCGLLVRKVIREGQNDNEQSSQENI